MSLAVRVIPTLLCKGRTLYKGERFNAWRSCGMALQAAQIHAMRGVDELVLLDIGATPEGRGPDLQLVEQLAAAMHTPLAVGGGVRTIEDVKNLLRAGADKVVIGAAAYHGFVEYASFKVGKQAIVAAVDYNAVNQVFTRNGLGYAPELDPKLYAQMLEFQGAGEILLTNIDREGMMTGYDIATIKKVAQAVDIPVIAHGGCASYADMALAIDNGASAVAAGAIFQFTDATPAEAAQYLSDRGYETRNPKEGKNAIRTGL